ncbi:excalibur calcium-binding domain-containing protein [Luteococcus sp. OSA5]|uniref:excalibur calcium-binding domain-containing protein n=1 Tax=Luteococcus sp. OSA5 TaxID=3401630 RepID=UPI003B4391BF
MSNTTPPPPPSNWHAYESARSEEQGTGSGIVEQKKSLFKKKRFWLVAAPLALWALGSMNQSPDSVPAAAPMPAATVTVTQAAPTATVTATATATATVTATATSTVTAPAMTAVEDQNTSGTTRVGLAQAPAAQQGSGGTDPRMGTCTKAKAAGYGPYRQGQDPEYDWYQDRDGDGVVCE